MAVYELRESALLPPEIYRIEKQKRCTTWKVQGNDFHRRYPIDHGHFYQEIIDTICWEYYRTKTCGTRGTINYDAILFTFLANGSPVALHPDHATKYPTLLAPALRRR